MSVQNSLNSQTEGARLTNGGPNKTWQFHTDTDAH